MSNFNPPANKDILDASDVASAAAAYALVKWGRKESESRAMEWAFRGGLYSAGGRVLQSVMGPLTLPMLVNDQYAYSALMAVGVDIAMGRPSSGMAESALIAAGSNFLGDVVTRQLIRTGDFKLL